MGGSAKRYGMESTREGGLDLEVRLRGIETAIANYTPSNQDVDLWSAARNDAVPRLTGIKLTGQGPGFVSVGWDPTTISDLVRYEVQFAENYNFAEEVQSFDTVTNNYLFGTGNLFGAASGIVYYCRVRAENSIGTLGPWSEILNTTTGLLVRGDIEDGGIFPYNLFEDSVASLSIDELQIALMRLEGLRGPISGLTLSRVSGSRINVGRGSTSRLWDQLGPGGMTKSSATWQPGDDVGGMAFGVAVIPNTWYDVFLIMRDSDMFIDVGFDRNHEAYNLMVDSLYDRYRLLGSVLTDDDGYFIDFTQVKEMFTWATTVDENLEDPISTWHNKYVLTTPPHMVNANINVAYETPRGAGDNQKLHVSSNVIYGYGDEPDRPIYNSPYVMSGGGRGPNHTNAEGQQYKILVGPDARIAVRSLRTNTIGEYFDNYEVGTVGWEHVGLHSPVVKETVNLDLPNNFAVPTDYYAKIIAEKSLNDPDVPHPGDGYEDQYQQIVGSNDIPVDPIAWQADARFDESEGFLVLWTYATEWKRFGECGMTVRTGTGAVDGGGDYKTDVLGFPKRIFPYYFATNVVSEGTGTRSGFSAHTGFSPESPAYSFLGIEEAAWALYQGASTNMANLLVLPHDNEWITHRGANLGVKGSEWFSSDVEVDEIIDAQRYIGNNQYQVYNADKIDIEHGEEDYLILAMSAPTTADDSEGDTRSLRWYWLWNGEDLFNVQTGTTTPGAQREGAGFSLRTQSSTINGQSNTQYYYTPFVVKNLTAVDHVPHLVINQWEDEAPGRVYDWMESSQLYVQRTSMLSKFTHMVYDKALPITGYSAVLNDPHMNETPFVVQIYSDGITPIVIGISTTLHMADRGGGFNIVRGDGKSITKVTDDPVDLNHTRYMDSTGDPSFGTGDDNNGVGNTDCMTIPLSMIVIDENPVSGNITYSLRADKDWRFNTIDHPTYILNGRDDGSDGFQGTMFAFELKLATTNY